MTKFNSDEMVVIQMALEGFIEDLKFGAQIHDMPLTPESRQSVRDMINCATETLAKMKTAAGFNIDLEKFDDDTTAIFTKPS